MVRHLAAFLVVVGLSGCASMSPPTAPRSPVVNEFTYDATFDQVWTALMERAVNRSWPIKTSDKASGIVMTDFFSIGHGVAGYDMIRQLAYEPQGLLRTWTGGARESVGVIVKKVGDSTVRVKIVPHFEAFENNITKQWHVWDSNGRQEAVLDAYIKDSLRLQR